MTDSKALGIHSMWGFSPALDAGAVGAVSSAGRPLRVLVAQPSDIRHVLASISRRRRHGMPPIHFFVAEKQIEVLARHLVLLQLACDWELPIRQRATVFLEVFGNSLLQERTAHYVHRLGQELVELVCDERGSLSDVVDLSLLKYRERDQLVEALRAWDPKVPYDLVGLRDHRLRAHFGLRYDNKVGVIDWDYQARVKPAASIIHAKLYKEWRLSGVAFEFGDQRYDEPNRTLGSYAEGVMKKGKDKGFKKEVRGYWLDVVNSPYISFGVACAAPHLFEVSSKGSAVEQHKHHTVEVAVYNLLSCLWEVETGEKYELSKSSDVYSGLGEDASDMAWHAANDEQKDERAAADSRRVQALNRARCIVETFSDTKVSLLHGGVDDLIGKASFAGSFDLVILSALSAHALANEAFPSLLADQGRVVVETAKYIVPLSGDQEQLYDTRLQELAAARDLAKCTIEAERGHFMAFERTAATTKHQEAP